MSVIHLLSRLKELQVGIRVENDRLRINVPDGLEGALCDGLLNQLKENKEAIIHYLQNIQKEPVYSGIEPVEKKDFYPLSAAQQRLHVVQQIYPDRIAYNMPQIVRLQGDMDINREKLEHAFRTLIQRHESLRTSFHIVEEQLVQKVHPKVEFEIEYYLADRETQSTKGKEDRCEPGTVPFTSTIKHFVRPFDLSEAPLLRVGVVHTDQGSHNRDTYILIADMHHIISDGMSTQLLINEFMALYQNQILPELRLQYKDYAVWKNSRELQEIIKKQGKYWLKEFSGEWQALYLPTDYPRPMVQRFEGDRIEVVLGENETRGIKNIEKQTGTTLFMILLAIYYILLSKLSGQEDIVVGSPVAGRRHPDLESVIGVFINTLALRNYPATEKCFDEFLSEVKENSLDAFENQDYQYEELVEKIQPNRDLGRNPLFDVMLVVQNMEMEFLDIPGIEFRPFEYLQHMSKFDMTVTAREKGHQLDITITYSTALFTKETIRRFINYFKRILAAVLKNTRQKIKEIDILADDEKKLLYGFNLTEEIYTRDITIRRLFEEQVEQTPDRAALFGEVPNPAVPGLYKEAAFGDNILITYKELNKISNELAWVLIEKGVKSDFIVAIMLERSVEMIIGILGILKAGGTYLPIDPDFPEDRILYMLRESNARFFIKKSEIPNPKSRCFQTNPNDTNSNEQNKRTAVTVLDFEHLNFGFLIGRPRRRFSNFDIRISDLNASASNLAYIIYTSGSTGNPKGVMVEHRNVNNLVMGLKKRIYSRYPGNLAVSLVAPYIFDASVKQIFAALLLGHTLHIVPEGSRMEGISLLSFFKTHHIDISDGTPVHLYLLADSGGRKEWSGFPVKHFLIGGEALSLKILREFLKQLRRYGEPGKTMPLITNVYGPTECCVDSTSYDISQENGLSSTIPIGTPMPNQLIYILDTTCKLVPVGTPGELCIGGANVGRGYLNNPELTAEKFQTNIAHELHKLHELTRNTNKKFLRMLHDSRGQFLQKAYPGRRRQKIYKTGDLGRWKPDGNIEFLGRIDHQVKLRGFRVEPEEIKNKLLAHGAIKEAVVIHKQDKNGDNYLCAYVRPVPGKEPKVSSLREYLSHHLPHYLIPSYFVFLHTMPLTYNGKIDRAALPAHEINTGQSYTAPGNEIEWKLEQIWLEVLSGKTASYNSIGIDSNFFELGGHSLKATALISKIHKEFNINVPLRDIFKYPTIKGLAGFLKTAGMLKYESLKPVERKEYYVLSSMQKRLYILQQMELAGTVYNMPRHFLLADDIDVENLEKNFKKLLERHESLRTSFHLIGEEPFQVIHDVVEFEIEYYCAERKAQSVERKEEGYAPSTLRYASTIKDFVRHFDLSQAPLLRVFLVQAAGKAFPRTLFLDMHHIITDAVSQNVLIDEFISLYQGKELLPLPLQYKEYAEWRNSPWQQQLITHQESFWLKLLSPSHELPVLNLPLDYSRPIRQSFQGNRLRFMLNEKETKQLKTMAKQSEATLYMAILALFSVLLAKLSGQEDIIVGTPTAARRHSDLEHIIGMFVNTLVMRNYPSGEKTFFQFLKEVKQLTLDAYENQDYPFDELVDKISLRRDTSRNPVFDVMFNLLDQSQYPADIPGMTKKKESENNHENIIGTSKVDLTLNGVELENSVQFTFEYCTKLFKAETIERFTHSFRKIIFSVIKDPVQKIGGIDIIPEPEKQLLLYEFNNTYTRYPKDKTLHQLFEEQVERTPDYKALVGQSAGRREERHAPCAVRCAITYRELNEKSNRLAYKLQKKGMGPDTIVGIITERSIGMVVGIMGILKSGGAYLPIDPNYPQDRIDYMLTDSGVKVLVTTHMLATDGEKVGRWKEEKNFEILFLDTLSLPSFLNPDFPNFLTSQPPHCPLLPTPGYRSPATSLAYIIYTSGSTGKPKGIMVEHRSVINFIKGITTVIPFRESDRILSLTTMAFDIFGLETLVPFSQGSGVVLGSREEQLEPAAASIIIQRENISIFQVTPSRLQMMISLPGTETSLGLLEFLLVGGESFPGPLLEKVGPLIRGKIYNMYGPTETTIWSTLKDLSGNAALNIGKPIANTKVYIVDRAGKLQPLEVVGELCIGGAGLARGYSNRPGLTAEKFDHDLWDYQDYHDGYHRSYRSYNSYTIYRTGDLARWLADGNLEFLGRIDNQVKIRGFRIELGEIETRLLKYPGIKEAVVISRDIENNDKYLCAYIVSDGELEVSELRDHLSRLVPDYMIPTYFKRLEKIPVTTSGKVDRKALPTPGEWLTGKTTTAPGNELEKKLAAIWSEVLAIEKDVIGIEDNFFERGGHSLKATIMIAKIHKAFHVRVPLAVIFNTPTIKELSGYIRGEAEDRFEAIAEGEKKEYYPLSPAQKRLYILQQMKPTAVYYNLPTFAFLLGKSGPKKLEGIFKKLIARHESLRTSFHIIDDRAVQKIHDEVKFEVEYSDLPVTGASDRCRWEEVSFGEKEGEPAAGNPQPTAALISSFLQPFDLSQAPLIRVSLVKINEKKHFLMVDIHHVVADGISMQILIREFMVLSRLQELPGLRVQYKDFSEWQNQLFLSDEIKRQEKYWLEEFAGEISVLDLPLDYKRPALKSVEGSFIRFETDSEETKELKKLALDEGTTLFMVLLALYNILLSKISWQEDIVVGTSVAGRRHADLEPLIGMFINTLALRNKPQGEKTFKRFLNEVSKKTVEAFKNQDYPFEDLVEKAAPDRDASQNPLFDTRFSFHNERQSPGIPVIEIPGLKLVPYQHVNLTSKSDLTLHGTEIGNRLLYSFEYCTKLFKKTTIQQFVKYFQEILSCVIKNKNIKLEDIEISYELESVEPGISQFDLEF